MKGLNQVQLIGNLGNDPEMRFTPAGKPVTSFSLATSRKYAGQDGQLVEDTCWHRIVCWDKTAELCNKSIHKGSPVFVQGRISNRQWEDQAGEKHYSSEVVANQVIFLEKPTNGKVEAEPEMVEVPDNVPF